jgi:hypothetical protein
MPEISYFYGIKVYINFNEHNPPHFHAQYAEYKIIVYIDGWIVEGKFPKRALNMLLDWADAHKEELLEDWNLAMLKQLPNKIDPLK